MLFRSTTVLFQPTREITFSEVAKITARATCIFDNYAGKNNISDLDSHVWQNPISSIPSDHWIKPTSSLFNELGIIDSLFNPAGIPDREYIVKQMLNAYLYVTGDTCEANEESPLSSDTSGLASENDFNCAYNKGIYRGVISGGQIVAKPKATSDRQELATHAVNLMSAVANFNKWANFSPN